MVAVGESATQQTALSPLLSIGIVATLGLGVGLVLNMKKASDGFS